ncbi:MAG: Mur ligase family protein [Solirubrobacterales bacterium]
MSGAELPAASPRPELPPGPYLVAGIGRAGFAALDRLRGRGDEVSVWDGLLWPGPEQMLGRLRAEGVRTHAGGDGGRALAAEPRPRCVVKSPGIPFDQPLIAAAREAGVAVIDELELGWRLEPRPLVAVTGTNGKSTVSALVEAILRAAGVEPLLAGNTNFGHPLSGVGDAPGEAVVCEVSSYQLEGCSAFIPEVGVLTNVSRDHLYRHRSLGEYERLKRSMFIRERACQAAALNADDALGAPLARELLDRGTSVATFGFGAAARWRIEACEPDGDRSRLAIGGPGGKVRLAARLPGRHNAENVAAALAVAELCAIDAPTAIDAVEGFAGLPGRFQRIRSPQAPEVVVDYAHNPAGVAGALETAREIAAARGGRLTAVVSVLSIYDPELSAAIGAAAASGCDSLVVTAERMLVEEPREPSPALVEAAEGGPATLEVVPERREAIAAALAASGPRDLVAVLGRGDRDTPIFESSGAVTTATDAELVAESLADG